MQQSVTADSTTLSYWLNWRVLLCSVLVLTPIVIALFLLWKYESLKQMKCEEREGREDLGCELNDDDVWRPCLEGIHPFWLLGYRVVAFCFTLSTITIKVVVNGVRIFYYYTQWTFTLVTIYFGFGTLLSIYGCYEHQKMRSCGFNVQHDMIDAEQGCYMPLTNRKDTNVERKALNPQARCNISRAAGISSYLFQVIFQMNAGAVMLTDFIYWSTIFPFVTIKDFKFNFVPFSGIHTSTMLWLVCIDCKCQALPVVKMVSSVIPVFKINIVGLCICQAGWRKF
ncbi:hypothetical protein REPUB_Repub10bG0026300 [Reevesia pubescens]